MKRAVTVGFLAAAASAALSGLTSLPQPLIHDEFSYLLAADTFAHGRLANPAHPMGEHLEAVHVLQQPSYASKYPPGQGLSLAIGRLAGLPILGVWLGVGFACGAITWMLHGWLRPRWALVGSIMAVAWMVPSYWSQSYWGGALAAGGGALVFGALRHKRPIVFAIGLVILANTRPFEGLVASLPAMIFVVAKWRRAILPALAVLVVAAVWMGYYNHRVTGRPLAMPSQVHDRDYHVPPNFVWQDHTPGSDYRHPFFHELYSEWATSVWAEQQSLRGWATHAWRKAKRYGGFYFGVLLIPLVMLPWVFRDRWMRFAGGTLAVVLAGLLQVTWVHEHYAAPVTGLVFVLIVQSLRQIRLWRWHRMPAGASIVSGLVLLWFASHATSFRDQRRSAARGWAEKRTSVLEQLKREKGPHLVLVQREGKGFYHYDWICNGARIDDQPVVWAREMGAEKDRRLLDYFKGRRAWLLVFERDSVQLKPY